MEGLPFVCGRPLFSLLTADYFFPVFFMKYVRIKKNTEFQKIFAKGKRGFSARLTLLYLPSDELKMGVCVSKKHGDSVRRNRVKRILREIFRLHIDRLQSGYSYVLLPKVAEEYDYRTLEKDFLRILEKQKLTRELPEKREEKA